MYQIITAINDMVVILFDLLVYTKLTLLKKDTRPYRLTMYSSCAVILLAYFLATYVFHMPAAISSFFTMSLPSLSIFWLLSKHKDSRFFVTFCAVDTLSLIAAFFFRTFGIYGGLYGALIGCIAGIAILTLVYVKGLPLYPRYRSLLDSIKEGWGAVMVAAILAYAMMVFVATYPEPMINRLEYVPVYLLVSAGVGAFYVVFISSLFQRKHLKELNLQLTEQMHWHDMAYEDGLTGMYNRMAYMERISRLSRDESFADSVYAVMVDIDDFKKINDTIGHHAGDQVLVKAARLLQSVFSEECYEVYRIGGDEFAIIAITDGVENLKERLDTLNNRDADFICAFSYGYAKVDFEVNNAMENAFIAADRAMYCQKILKKETDDKG